MGRRDERIVIALHLSNHGDEQDEIDKRLADELRAEIEKLLAQPKYESLSPWTV